MTPHPRKADPNNILIFKPEYCGECGACVAVCGYDSLILYPYNYIAIDMNTCILCNACVRVCPTEALAIVPVPPPACGGGSVLVQQPLTNPATMTAGRWLDSTRGICRNLS